MKATMFFAIFVLLCMPLAMAMTGTETVTRSVSTSTVAPGGTFTLSYTANGVSGSWGATLLENIQGGCTVSGKTQLQFAMLSDLPNPLTYTVQAPSSNANCVFHGDYKFGSFAVVPFTDATVVVGTAPCPSGQFLCNGVCAATCGECTSGATQACSVGSCPGTSTCSANIWGNCVKTVSTCGVPVGGINICDTLSKVDFISGKNDCTIGGVMLVVGFIALLLILKK